MVVVVYEIHRFPWQREENYGMRNAITYWLCFGGGRLITEAPSGGCCSLDTAFAFGLFPEMWAKKGGNGLYGVGGGTTRPVGRNAAKQAAKGKASNSGSSSNSRLDEILEKHIGGNQKSFECYQSSLDTKNALKEKNIKS
ncbi:hypothetical protein LXL04_030002 [Taraxacum kok-saghyz]